MCAVSPPPCCPCCSAEPPLTAPLLPAPCLLCQLLESFSMLEDSACAGRGGMSSLSGDRFPSCCPGCLTAATQFTGALPTGWLGAGAVAPGQHAQRTQHAQHAQHTAKPGKHALRQALAHSAHAAVLAGSINSEPPRHTEPGCTHATGRQICAHQDPRPFGTASTPPFRAAAAASLLCARAIALLTATLTPAMALLLPPA